MVNQPKVGVKVDVPWCCMDGRI